MQCRWLLELHVGEHLNRLARADSADHYLHRPDGDSHREREGCFRRLGLGQDEYDLDSRHGLLIATPLRLPGMKVGQPLIS